MHAEPTRITFDGTNISEVAAYAGDRFEGLLIRNGAGDLALVQAGFILEGEGDDLDIWSPGAWRRKQEREAA